MNVQQIKECLEIIQALFFTGFIIWTHLRMEKIEEANQKLRQELILQKERAIDAEISKQVHDKPDSDLDADLAKKLSASDAHQPFVLEPGPKGKN